MQLTTLAALVGTFAAGASAHIAMIEPPALRGSTNTFAVVKDPDPVRPLSNAEGRIFPCHGFLPDLDGPGGASVKTYQAGSTAQFTLKGVEAAHNGGSCQASLSFDKGKTWKVIKSYIGNCVRSKGGNVFDPNQTYDFTIPADAKAGPAVFAWTWFNQSGNREMYMGCASVTIAGSGTSTLDDHPDIFVANVDNGCGTTEGVDLQFPNPGKDIETNPAFNGAKTGPPTGTCAAPSGAPSPPTTALPPTTTGTGEVVAAPPTGGSGLTHTVAPGEFCFSIAQANGVTVPQIIAANPDVNAGCTNLKVGQILNLRRRSRVMRV